MTSYITQINGLKNSLPMIFEKMLKSERILALQKALQHTKDILLIEELWNAPKALIAALAQQVSGKHVLILTGSSQEEARLFHDLSFFTNCPTVDFPSWETLPSENVPPSPDIVGERYQLLKKINSSSEPHIILTSLQACLQKLIAPSAFQKLYLTLKTNESFFFDDLIQKLNLMGYQRKFIASDKGEFAVRGGIIDVFPVSSPDPYRLEFWGDDLESIRIYDPIGQISVRTVEQIDIAPGLELELLNQSNEQASFLDYLGPETLIIFDDLLALEDRYASLISLGANNKFFSSIEEFIQLLTPYQKMFWSQKPIEELSEVKHLDSKQSGYYSQTTNFHNLKFQMFNRDWTVKRWRHPFNTITNYFISQEEQGDFNGDEILYRLPSLSHETFRLDLLCASELEENNLRQKILSNNIHLPKQTTYQIGYLSSGLVIQDQEWMILPLTELTHRYKIRRQKLRSTYHTSPAETYDLTPGEMIVHLNNGIGRYLGIEKRANHLGILSEFFTIEYADQAKLYVPFNQAHLITKYLGSNEVIPKLHTIGSSKWKKAKEHTERAILGYASDLLKSYAEREIKEGFAYPIDSADLQSFEGEFPFSETEDQLAAISSIKQDMMSKKAMDRLICGDVGYGKTEVAMRAAFKAVTDGAKQVAVLVPTTVLAMQHFDNFLDRMANFPINIGILSRFRTQKQIQETLEGIANGFIDIVIGTHRIIGEDVKFKDLGLVIIDEEQRFGVKAKEHLKKIKIGVDCLTLSATPIPRTLYMSLIGARDMSVINTPPQDRLPTKTIITEPSDQIIQNALLRELSRDGQAFVIHNRVESIYSVSNRIKSLLPQARVLVAHGQMHADEIDATFHAFKSGQADILVATTIVENGVDIPNANTILIDRADHFGLAALYQLRGRVGRWNRRAYAYFLVPNLRVMPELTRKRLQALSEASGYGSGMKVAMRDLEIRGAGDILGLEQSGHVSSIGFHLYCKMLKRTIQTLQGKLPSIVTETKIELTIDARLPEDYVNEVSLRMEVYQRLGEAFSLEEVDSIWSEIRDRFGPPPEPAQWLYHLTRIRVHASRFGFTLIKQEKLSLTMEKGKKGKDLIIRKILMPKFKSPQELETKIIAELNQKF
ncbi:transcription-repair coupling factor [Candidatus Protochlamydia sp. W-9]|uniref:transcription-repair coupling factor n=1 Tax=Candidatus Protochlamydia sp. W-9 TaxID=1785087 RepID=UPI001D0439C3|nr:transcription-repair coupling factor [Candidatus Protochlamydia sp. W-9]